MSKPTKFTPGNKGDIYTDSETGVKYECLGPLGFTDAVKRNPPEHQWDEAHPSKYGGGGTDLGAREEIKEVILVDNAKVTTEPVNIYIQAENPFEIVLKRGHKYTVIFDGVEYEVVENYPEDIESSNLYHIGNLEISLPGAYGKDTGEPFGIQYDSNDGWTCLATSEAGEHTVTIKTIETIITPIDEKWLPKPTVFYYDDGPLVDADGNNITYEQAVAAGRDVVIMYMNGDNEYECYPVSMVDDGSSVFYRFFVADNNIVTTNAGSGPV